MSELLLERRLNLTTAIVAASHEDDIFPFRFRFGVKPGNGYQHCLARYFERQFNYPSGNVRQIDASVYTASDGNNGVILADWLPAPSAFRSKLSGAPCEKQVDLAATFGSDELPELAHR